MKMYFTVYRFIFLFKRSLPRTTSVAYYLLRGGKPALSARCSHSLYNTRCGYCVLRRTIRQTGGVYFYKRHTLFLLCVATYTERCPPPTSPPLHPYPKDALPFVLGWTDTVWPCTVVSKKKNCSQPNLNDLQRGVFWMFSSKIKLQLCCLFFTCTFPANPSRSTFCPSRSSSRSRNVTDHTHTHKWHGWQWIFHSVLLTRGRVNHKVLKLFLCSSLHEATPLPSWGTFTITALRSSSWRCCCIWRPVTRLPFISWRYCMQNRSLSTQHTELQLPATRQTLSAALWGNRSARANCGVSHRRKTPAARRMDIRDPTDWLARAEKWVWIFPTHTGRVVATRSKSQYIYLLPYANTTHTCWAGPNT